MKTIKNEVKKIEMTEEELQQLRCQNSAVLSQLAKEINQLYHEGIASAITETVRNDLHELVNKL